MGRAKKFVLKFLVMVTSVLVTLAIAEMYVRYTLSVPPFGPETCVPDYIQDFDKQLVWRASSEDNRNSLGLRNREIGPVDPDVARILFLGDSLVWYGETSSGELHTQVIEQKLRQEQGENAVEVINSGIPGWTTYQEHLFLKLYGMAMEPDVVVLTFVFNDVHYPYLHNPFCDGVLGWHPDAFLRRLDENTFLGKLLGGSYLAHDVAYRLDQIFGGEKPGLGYVFEHRVGFYYAWKEYAWKKTYHLIQEIQNMLAEKGIEFRIVIIPVSEQFHESYDADDAYLLYPQQKMQSICNTLQIKCLDLTSAIAEGGGMDLYRDYLHLSEEGNDLFAREVASWLSASPKITKKSE